MKILVDRLSTTPEHYAFRANEAWWRQRVPPGDSPGELVDAFEVDVDAHLMGADILFSGNLRGVLELECGRCLTRYRHALQEDFQLVAEPAGTRVPADPEAAVALREEGLCLGDEPEVGWYQGGEIHLDSLCLEVISLALPVQPLCRESCPGLCSRCGAELAEGPCGCDEARPNSPFAVLAALRDETEGVS
jgi:uncharacterized protein